MRLKGKNPTALKRHTESKHKSVFKKYEEDYKAEMASINGEGSSRNERPGVPLLPAIMKGHFSTSKKYKRDDPRQQQFNHNLAMLIGAVVSLSLTIHTVTLYYEISRFFNKRTILIFLSGEYEDKW